MILNKKYSANQLQTLHEEIGGLYNNLDNISGQLKGFISDSDLKRIETLRDELYPYFNIIENEVKSIIRENNKLNR